MKRQGTNHHSVLLHPAGKIGLDNICAFISFALVFGDAAEVLFFDLCQHGMYVQAPLCIHPRMLYLGTFSEMI